MPKIFGLLLLSAMMLLKVGALSVTIDYEGRSYDLEAVETVSFSGETARIDLVDLLDNTPWFDNSTGARVAAIATGADLGLAFGSSKLGPIFTWGIRAFGQGDDFAVDGWRWNFETNSVASFSGQFARGNILSTATHAILITVTLSHLGVATLTPEALAEVKTGLATALDFGDVATRRYLQAGSGLELIAVGDATIVTCPVDRMDPCVGTASKVKFSTMPITTSTSAPTVKSGKGSKSGGSKSNSKSSKSGKNSEGTSSPTVPGVTTSPTMKSGKGGKGHMRI
eukprot:scaffold230836_cov82-Attheya_sp.AAC.1